MSSTGGGVRKLTYLKLVSAVLGLLYSIFQVRIFGTTPEIESYFAATSLMYLIASFTQSGQLAEIFLPAYLSLRTNEGPEEAHKAFSVVINRLIIGILVLLLIGVMASELLVKIMVPGFEPGQQFQVMQFFIVSLPYVALTVCNSFLTSLLNAERAFGKSETAAVFSAVASLIMLFALGNSIGPWTLLLSLYVGQVTELFTSILFLRKYKIKYSFIFKTEKFDSRIFFKNLKSTSLYVICTQVFTVVLISSISFLPQGVFAIYRYTLQIFEKAFSIMIMPLSTVFFTSVAESIAKNDLTATKGKIKDNVEYAVLISVVSLAVVVVAGFDIIAVVWSSKKFDITSVDLAYEFIVMWFVIFIAQAVSLAFRRTSVSVNLASKQYGISAVLMLLSAVISYFAIKYFAVNGLFASIALSRVFFLSVPIMLIGFFRKDLLSFPSGTFFIRVTLAFAVTVLVGYYLREFVSGYLMHNKYMHFFNALLFSVSAVVLFVGLAYVLKFDKVVIAMDKLKTKFV